MDAYVEYKNEIKYQETTYNQAIHHLRPGVIIVGHPFDTGIKT